MHGVTHKFESVASLRSALYHEFDDAIPVEGDYNVGFFEGKQQAKKWLVSSKDLEAMYVHFQGKPCISLWCDGKEPAAESDEEKTSNKKQKRDHGLSKRNEKEEELEDIFQNLKEKHGNEYSGPQLRLWARMIIAHTHDDMNNPPKVSMITGSVQKQPRRESLTDAFASAATAIAKAISPAHSQQSDASPSLQVRCSPSKTVDIRMKNLDQLRCLQRLWEDGILTEEEFLAQKRIVLHNLV